MHALHYRHAEPEDYPAIITVLDAWWGGRRMADMLPRLFFEHFRPGSFVAQSGETIAGFVISFISQTQPDQAYIHFVGVHPDFRQQDIAQTLYAQVFRAAAQQGCRTIRCVTSPHNEASIRFHRALGFQAGESPDAIGGTPYHKDYDGPGEDRVCFYKALA